MFCSRTFVFIYSFMESLQFTPSLLFLIAKWYVVRNSNAIWVLSSALFCGLNTVLDAQKHFKWDTFPKWHHCDPLGIEDRTHVWENHALPITLIMFVRVFAIIIINNVTNCYPIQGIYWCTSQINYNNDKQNVFSHQGSFWSMSKGTGVLSQHSRLQVLMNIFLVQDSHKPSGRLIKGV